MSELEKAFPASQRDSYCKKMEEAHVVSCTPCKGKGKKGVYEIVLDDSILFAEGGGQPCDQGTVAGYPCAVVRVDKARGNAVVHEVALGSAAALAPGAVVAVELEWKRRFDHMQQHTAQHILSTLAADRYGLPTVGWALHADRTVIEVEAPAGVTPEVVEQLEAAANDVIRERRPIVVTVYSPENVPEHIRTRGAVPKDGTPIRIVEVEGLSSETCCGTHVRNTAELQALKIIGTEHSRQGTVRIAFLAGGRVLAGLGARVAREKAIGKLLCCQPDGFAAHVEGLLAENSALAKQKKRLIQDLTALDAAALLEKAAAAAAEVPWAEFHRCAVGMDYLEAVAATIAAARPDVLFALTASEGPACDGKGAFLIIGPADRVAAVGKAAREALAAKGGGKGTKFQGKTDHMEKRPDFVSAVQQLFQ